MISIKEPKKFSFVDAVKASGIFAGVGCGISLAFLVFIIAVVDEKTGTISAEYCAEELVSRKPVDGRLVESRSCKSWVGWPIEIREVKQ
jgi:hypothetical protein